jgi:leucyl aminopeptidase
MQIRVASGAPIDARTAALVVPVFSNEALAGAAQLADGAVGGALSEAIASGEFKGAFGDTLLVHAIGRPFKRMLAVGLGERKRFEDAMLARYAGVAVRALGRRNIAEIAVALPPEVSGRETDAASSIALGAIASSFEITTYQREPEKPMAVTSVTILSDGFDSDALERGVARGTIVGDAVNLARRLAVTPSNDMTPTILANEAETAGRAAGVEVEIHDEAWAREKGMGSFLSVARGSAEPPKFIVMRYNGDPSSKELLALVGKGITFDTGGISIKPADRMEDMKYDMSGGAAVIASMVAIGKLRPKVNVVGIVPATENMPGGKATKPGDIVTAMNGKTIEVINTDAEGRLILADGLCYANELGATRIAETATLTGAVVIALGHAAAAVVSNDDDWADRFVAVSKTTGERFWRMPYYEEYAKQMKSDIADLKNTGGRAAGTLTAAAFLKSFVGETPWVHVDIAGTAYLDGESGWQAKGPTGMPVRTFVALAESLASGNGASASNGETNAAAVSTR